MVNVAPVTRNNNEKIIPHWDAQLYKENSLKLQHKTALDILNKITLSKDDSVLDIGAGDGKISKYIAEQVTLGQVHAFDISKDMVALAKEDFAATKNLHLWVDNAESFQLNEKYNWIFSFFCLQWVANKTLAFENIAAHLKTHGKVIAVMTNRNAYLLEARQSLNNTPKYASFFKEYIDETNVIDNDSYEIYAMNAGLKNIQYSEYDKKITFRNREELVTFIKMVTPASQQIPYADIQNSYLNALIDIYIHLVSKHENIHERDVKHITYRIKILHAEK